MNNMMKFLILATFCQTFIAQGKIRESLTLNIHENGLDFEETISFDVDNNLQIVDVPAHFDRLATTFIKDLTHMIQMQVRWETKKCLIGNIVIASQSFPQMQALQHQTNETTFHTDHKETTHHNFIIIDGPVMERSEIPASLREHCPEGFIAQAYHTIEDNQIVSEDESIILVRDPSIVDDVVNDSIPPNVTDGLNFLSRRKRDACISLGLNDNCFEPTVNCPGGGCPASEAFYNCKNCNMGVSCEYIFVCNTITSGRECIAHITHTGRKCHLCCGNMDCGDNMPKCGPGKDPELNC